MVTGALGGAAHSLGVGVRGLALAAEPAGERFRPHWLTPGASGNEWAGRPITPRAVSGRGEFSPTSAMRHLWSEGISRRVLRACGMDAAPGVERWRELALSSRKEQDDQG